MLAAIVGSTAVVLTLAFFQLKTASSAPNAATRVLYDAALGGTPDE